MPRLAALALLVLVLAVTAAPAAAQGPEAGPYTRTLYLVRHGAYDYEDPLPEDQGKGLIPLGVAQSRLVADRLRGLPVEWTGFTTSTLTRARQTAAVMAPDFPGLEIAISPLLSECTPPTRRQDIMERTPPEELEACTAQLEEAFATFFVPAPDRERHDLLVCHGNVIRYFVTRALDVDPIAWLGMGVANCSITVIRVRPDGTCAVLAVGDKGHIPPNLQSGLTRSVPELTVPPAPEVPDR